MDCESSMPARDLVRERYYEDRAAVYDLTSYRGDAEVDRGLDRETAELGSLLSTLAPGRVLDVGCGTAGWTRFLRGDIVAMDQSLAMLRIAETRVPHAKFVQALFPPLPFTDGSFDRLFTSNFYGLLRAHERHAFLVEARRVAREVVIVDLRSDHDEPMEGIETREIGRGRTYEIYRRRFSPSGLCEELDGELLYPGRYFLAVRVAFNR